jgi:hypothetical protein
MLSFCDNKYFQRTQGEVKDSDGQVKHCNDWDELLGMSTSSMDFDTVSVEGEDRQYLTLPATSTSPEWFFSRVGLEQTELCGRFLDTTHTIRSTVKLPTPHTWSYLTNYQPC